MKQQLLDKANQAESWLQAHTNLIAFVLVALGFAARLIVAARTWLNPDEALHYLLVNQPTLADAYRGGLTQAHPPLFFLFLHYWRLVGHSELVLRLPFVLAGTAFLWLAYKWLRELLGPSEALIGLLLFAFSPSLIVFSAEVRQYAQLLLFQMGALLYLERAVSQRSARMMFLFSTCLWLAILSHYSALWFTIAIGIYTFVLIFQRKLPGRVVSVWAAGQAVAASLYGLLWLTHLSRLRGGAMEQGAMQSWLSRSYFQPGRENVARFALHGTASFFGFAFGQDEAGVLIAFLFLGWILLLLFRRPATWRGRHGAGLTAFLLLLPFAICCSAAVARLYPYGGTRHDLFLVPFAVAGVAAALSQVGRRRLTLGFAIALALIAGCRIDASPPDNLEPSSQAKALMAEALDYLHRVVPYQNPLLLEYQSALVVFYYLCPQQFVPVAEPRESGILDQQCSGYRIVATPAMWGLTEGNFAAQFARLCEHSRLSHQDTIWTVHTGWNATSGGHTVEPRSELAASFPQIAKLTGRDFGDNISIFEIQAPP